MVQFENNTNASEFVRLEYIFIVNTRSFERKFQVVSNVTQGAVSPIPLLLLSLA